MVVVGTGPLRGGPSVGEESRQSGRMCALQSVAGSSPNLTETSREGGWEKTQAAPAKPPAFVLFTSSSDRVGSSAAVLKLFFCDFDLEKSSLDLGKSSLDTWKPAILPPVLASRL